MLGIGSLVGFVKNAVSGGQAPAVEAAPAEHFLTKRLKGALDAFNGIIEGLGEMPGKISNAFGGQDAAIPGMDMNAGVHATVAFVGDQISQTWKSFGALKESLVGAGRAQEQAYTGPVENSRNAINARLVEASAVTPVKPTMDIASDIYAAHHVPAHAHFGLPAPNFGGQAAQQALAAIQSARSGGVAAAA